MKRDSVQEEKEKLRQYVLERLQKQPLTERNAKSKLICNKILGSREFNTASVVMLYAAMKYEVDTYEMIMEAFRMRKRVVLPCLNRSTRALMPCEIKDLERDTVICEYGYREPSDENGHVMKKEMIDIVILPGLAFDQSNFRLGRGIGCYDRFLHDLPARTPTFGLAFDFQMFAAIPAERHDIPLTSVIVN